MQKLYFISGLPRSGSTLLSNILSQNPNLHSTNASGCLDVLWNIRNHWHTLLEHKSNPNPEKLKNVLNGALESYYKDVNKPIIIDKSRGWLAYIEFIENIIGEKAKIITTVRPIPEILASFEKLYRETTKTRQPPGEKENYFQFQTIKGRCEYWMLPNQVVGVSLNRIEDAIKRNLRDRIYFVDFYQLTSNPTNTLNEIYDFIGEKPFSHDFNHVEQVTDTNDDDLHGFTNLHKIRSKVSPVPFCAKEILGEDIVKFYSN